MTRVDPTSRGPRLWPLYLAIAVYAMAFVWAWHVWDAPSRQARVICTTTLTGLLSFAVVGWLLVLSRLRWKTRLLGLLAMAVMGVVLSQMVTITGVSGDVVPILGWKWAAKADASLARELPATDNSAAPPASSPTDFPQYLGPRRNATVTGVVLARDWTQAPPQLVWRKPIGAGWSGFAVAGDRAITLEQRGPEERVVCYDLATGDVRWSHADATRFESVIAGDGPRSTPTIDGERVFAVGASGMLNVLDMATGRLVWSKDILADNGADVPIYGVAASPLVHDGKVFVVANGARAGSLVAYDRDTGEKLWNGGDAEGRYSSPMVATLGGREQVLLFYEGALRGHDPATGATLWEFRWPVETEEASQPVPVGDDRVFLSTGYGIGAKLIDLSTGQASLVWESTSLKAKFTNVVLHDGYIYGLDDGILVALDPADGSRKWKRGRYGHGHVLLVGDLLLVLSEEGEIALVDPRPDEYIELGRFQALEGKTWNTPALAGPRLLIRNATEAACYLLPLTAS